MKRGRAVSGPEAIQPRRVRGLLRTFQELTLDQQVERFRDLLKIVTDHCRKCLGGHESIRVPGEEQKEI